MLKKRVEASHAPRNGRFECSRLDNGSEALPNDRGYSRDPLRKGSRNVVTGTRQHSELQTELPRVA
jgi:hypothetical protein